MSKRIVTHPSKYGFKTQLFLACDDGARICWECAQPCDERSDKYGPARKWGECYNCGFAVAPSYDEARSDALHYFAENPGYELELRESWKLFKSRIFG